ncbi:MAG: hypothetical protein PHY48_03250 [Candidatus Cloacimonetes bacterium]|nr:hypothetical protein [Candidatus Cloacimonadota bacterium]
MNINATKQKYIDRIFSATVEYDNVVLEIGENADEPKFTLKVYNEGLLVFFVRYDVLNGLGY